MEVTVPFLTFYTIGFLPI